MTSKAVGIALVCIVIVCVVVGGLIWSGHLPLGTGGTLPPSSNTISLWNKTLVPAGYLTHLTASFTVPYSSVVLHVDWVLTFKHHYSGDQVSVATTLYLDGVQIDVKPYSDTLSYVYEQSLTVSANMPHVVKLSLVIMVQGPCYSTFNETASGWVSKR